MVTDFRSQPVVARHFPEAQTWKVDGRRETEAQVTFWIMAQGSLDVNSTVTLKRRRCFPEIFLPSAMHSTSPAWPHSLELFTEL